MSTRLSERKHVMFSPELWPRLESRTPGRQGGPGLRSAVLNDDLTALYDLYDIALREFPVSIGEARLLVDALDGTHMDAYRIVGLPDRVSSACYADDLGAKHGVDVDQFIGHLRQADRLTLLAINDAVRRYHVAGPSDEERDAVLRSLFVIE